VMTWNKGVWAGIVFALFALTFFFLSLEFPYSSPLGPGPGFLPLWISGLMLVLSVFYIAESIKSKEEAGEPMPRGAGLRGVLFVVLSLICYLILIPILGFLAASVLFLFTLFVRETKWYSSLGAALAVSFSLVWLFGSVLKVDLPSGIFGL